MSANLLNYVLYQTGWFATVLGAASGHALAGSVVALAGLGLHLALCRSRRAEWTLVAVAGALGLVVDSAQTALGLLTFPSGTLAGWLCPPWIVVMWMQFATTFRFGLRPLLERPAWTALAGAVGGPLAYLAGERIGAVALGEPRAAALAVLGVVWAVALPTLGAMARRRGPGVYPTRA
ncbi:MAG: DUF2878 domain-containing protein [Vicinamibacterales bacterium]